MNKNYLNNLRLRERRLSAHKCLACGKQLEENYTSVYCECAVKSEIKTQEKKGNGTKATKYVQGVARLK